MAGAMRKMGVYLGLVEDEAADVYDDGYDEDVHEAHETRPTRTLTPVREDKPYVAARPAPAPASRAPRPEGRDVVDSYRITTLHPRNYNDARTVGEYYRDGTPVIMNLTDMDDTDAKRLVDFAAGLVFGLHGTIERVTAKVFLLSPANVTVTAEEKARLAEGGFFNQS
ncbi:MAG TPA: cell division protein SepF [Actinomycetes bacterium]|nr:cell division protein SepF [Actinomycetes bacterium]